MQSFICLGLNQQVICPKVVIFWRHKHSSFCFNIFMQCWASDNLPRQRDHVFRPTQLLIIAICRYSFWLHHSDSLTFFVFFLVTKALLSCRVVAKLEMVSCPALFLRHQKLDSQPNSRTVSVCSLLTCSLLLSTTWPVSCSYSIASWPVRCSCRPAWRGCRRGSDWKTLHSRLFVERPLW